MSKKKYVFNGWENELGECIIDLKTVKFNNLGEAIRFGASLKELLGGTAGYCLSPDGDGYDFSSGTFIASETENVASVTACTHTPKCITECVRCGKPIPDIFDITPEVDPKVWKVTHENGCEHILTGGANSDEVAKLSMAVLARSAGLCMDHVVRVKQVRQLNTIMDELEEAQ